MKNKKIIPMIFILAISILIVLVSAYILDMHVSINDKSLSETASSQITQEILPYKDYFNLGVQIADISVVTYFDKSCDDTSIFGRIKCFFNFNIGKPYLASHSKSTCLRVLSKSQEEKDSTMRKKKYAFAMGWCAHIIQDADSHNHFVNLVVQRSLLYNGLVHSPGEIWLKNKVTTAQDRVYTRQVLSLAYEMTPFTEEVLVQDPAFSNIKIPELIDFFVKQVQGSNEYDLGFRSFFSIPSLVLWIVGILFLFSLTILALMIRRIREGEISTPMVFLGIFSLIILTLVGIAVYGVFTGTVWSIWEILSQYIFSGWTYLIIIILFSMAGWLIYHFIKKPNKKQNIVNILVALFLILLGIALLPMPTALQAVNPDTQFRLSVDHTNQLLIQGVNYVKTIDDPSGFQSIKEGENAGSGIRTMFTGSLILLLIGILYLTFRRKKRQ